MLVRTGCCALGAHRGQFAANTGANCVDIANETSSQYTLVAPDAGHEIRSGVRGKSLWVTKGAWKNPPAADTYQWLRCTSRGTSCTTIAGAKRSAYRLKAVDAGHKIEAKVTASNAAGSATVTSKTSGVIEK